jgi:hypothetical protein
MKRMPFKMIPSRSATLMRDGKFVVGGRASFVWECFLKNRAAGVSGNYIIRSDRNHPWHRLDWTIEEAEIALMEWSKMFGRKNVERARVTRKARAERGLPVG